MPPFARTALHSTRLVRSLAALIDTPSHDSGHQFSCRLGTLIDLGDSVKLASAQSGLKELVFKAGVVDSAHIRREFLSGRAAIINGILQACVPGETVSRIRFPEMAPNTPEAEATAPDAYVAFYRAQQNEIGYAVLRLHTAIRADISGLSPGLQQLAALDSALGTAMGNHLRGHFSAVPVLLTQHVVALRSDYLEQLDGESCHADAWPVQLGKLRADIQNLLLAEVEARLLPLQGLVEAINDGMMD